jgi:hypothetical protein
LDRIPDSSLDRNVSGFNLMPGSLRDQLGDDATLLVFLRYFGCIFCREMVADIRAAAENDPDYPAVLFFFQGTSTEGRAFLRRYWPDVRAIADPELAFYEDFGVEQGRMLQVFGPRVLLATRRARSKGHASGEGSGDPWRMPGLFLVRGPEILWSHRFDHQADHPDFAELPAIARAAVARRAAPAR